MILYAEARFRLPLLPFLCLVGAGGFSVLNREQRRKMFTQAHPRRILILGITIVVLLYGLAAVLFVFGLIS